MNRSSNTKRRSERRAPLCAAATLDYQSSPGMFSLVFIDKPFNFSAFPSVKKKSIKGDKNGKTFVRDLGDDCLTFPGNSRRSQFGTTYLTPMLLGRQQNLMTQKAEFVFEIEETVVLKQGGCLLTEYCPRCQEMVDMVSPEVLSLVNGVSEREIFRLVEIGEIHFIELGRVVACPSCYRHLLANRPQFDAELELGGSNICENEE